MTSFPSSRLILFASIWFTCISNLCGEAEKPFESMGLQEAERVINATESQQTQRRHVDAALHSRRMDLLKLCFENQYTMSHVLQAAKNLPDSAFRDQIVLMMLKSPSPAWPPDEPQVGSRSLSELLVREPFVSVIKKHLPDLPITKELFNSREARANVATDLETAMVKQPPDAAAPAGAGGTPPSSRITPDRAVPFVPKSIGASIPATPAPATSAAPTTSPAAAETQTPTGERMTVQSVSNPRFVFWLVGGAFVIGLIALWMKRRT